MNKFLVTYATRAGSTVEVATHVGEVLSEAGAIVEVRPIKDVQEVKSYDAVVIGSAIRMGHWLPEAVAFVKANRDTLSHIPTAYFLVSGLLREDTPEMRKTVLAYLDPVRAILEPTSIGLFAGKMDYSKLSWLDRIIAKKVMSEGDGRNWDAIQGWACELLATSLHA
jgi:menaquinone-dependent protoporphyrinogen oxidase